MKSEYFGAGSINNIPEILEHHKAISIFLVTGKKSFSYSGARDAINVYLNGKTIIHFSDFSENPKLDDVIKGVSEFKQTKCNVVIAIGGGTAIDMAKLINVIAHQNTDELNIATCKESIKRRGLPLIAIPTTSGSGSEATHFAAVYVNRSKYSVAHEYILPDYSIVDPSLTYNLPPKLTAISGFDALSQAVESYWSITSTEESREYASKSIRMILSALELAVNSPDEESRNSMALAAHLAGKAINITKTTASHAVSYPMTAYYNIPHGHAVALSLGKFFIVNFDLKDAVLNEPRGKYHLEKVKDELCRLFDCKSPQDFSKKWYELMSAVGLENDFKRLGICKQLDIDRIISNVNLERLGNNPVKISTAILKKLFE